MLYAFGTTLTAGYTSQGLRAWKQTAVGRIYYLYNGSVPVCELDSNGNVTAVNTWGVTGLLSRYAPGSSLDGSVFYCFDPQGSVSVRLDSGGNILSSHTHEAWGTQISTVATNDPYAGFGGQWGYYKDAETGLHLLGERYYDPNSGRFLNRDPIGYEGGINLFAYCMNNPVNYADPNGEQGLQLLEEVAEQVETNPFVQQGIQEGLQETSNACGEILNTNPFSTGIAEGISSEAQAFTAEPSLGLLTLPPSQVASLVDNGIIASAPIVPLSATGTVPLLPATQGLCNPIGYGLTLSPGPYADANGFYKWTGRSRSFSEKAKRTVREYGDLFGCHTCGTKVPGGPWNVWILDHQPANALNPNNCTVRLYPHCHACSQLQSNVLGDMERRKTLPKHFP